MEINKILIPGPYEPASPLLEFPMDSAVPEAPEIRSDTSPIEISKSSDESPANQRPDNLEA